MTNTAVETAPATEVTVCSLENLRELIFARYQGREKLHIAVNYSNDSPEIVAFVASEPFPIASKGPWWPNQRSDLGPFHVSAVRIQSWLEDHDPPATAFRIEDASGRDVLCHRITPVRVGDLSDAILVEMYDQLVFPERLRKEIDKSTGVIAANRSLDRHEARMAAIRELLGGS